LLSAVYDPPTSLPGQLGDAHTKPPQDALTSKKNGNCNARRRGQSLT
jgi:hypothetical protein